jgi:hypothetical protein
MTTRTDSDSAQAEMTNVVKLIGALLFRPFKSRAALQAEIVFPQHDRPIERLPAFSPPQQHFLLTVRAGRLR